MVVADSTQLLFTWKSLGMSDEITLPVGDYGRQLYALPGSLIGLKKEPQQMSFALLTDLLYEKFIWLV